MDTFSILGLKYARIIKDSISQAEFEALKKKFAYLYLSLHQKPALLAEKGLEILAKKTPVINLNQSLEEIFAKFNKTTRNEIKKTEKSLELKLTFKIPDKNWIASYKFYKRIKEKDDKVKAEPRKEFKPLKFFNAYQAGWLIVSIACYDTGQILRFKSIVSRRKETNFQPQVMSLASRRLIWEICRYGQNNGYQKIDLGVVNLNDPNKAGISQFKMAFGGDLVDVYIARWQNRLFKKIRPLFNFLKINLH